MNDLIRRQAAIDALDQYRKESGMSELLHWNAVKHVLSHVPSAEQERKKGEWLKEDLSGYLTPGAIVYIIAQNVAIRKGLGHAQD